MWGTVGHGDLYSAFSPSIFSDGLYLQRLDHTGAMGSNARKGNWLKSGAGYESIEQKRQGNEFVSSLLERNGNYLP